VIASDLERSAAYAAARAALTAIHDATAAWPSELAVQARRAAVATVATTAEGLAFGHNTAARRRCVRKALNTAIAMAAAVDVARALGHSDPLVDRAQYQAGRAIALLGLLFQASAMQLPD